MLYFSHKQVVFQEVPGEVSLSFSVSGCNLKCHGCHSAFTWDAEYGEPLTTEVLIENLNKYKDLITCVLFFGGEWRTDYLLKLFSIVKDRGLKVALYTGSEVFELDHSLVDTCDLLKVGRYVAELGGLQSPSTNQRFLRREGSELVDRTDIFWKTLK